MASRTALRRVPCLALAFSATLVTGCRAKTEPAVPLSVEGRELRVAASFIHCVEAGPSTCVEAGDRYAAWDALHLLLWTASGSPLAILQSLGTQLSLHNDPLHVQRSFVGEVERYANVIRGAQCEAKDSMPLGPLIDRAATVTEQRLATFGISTADLADVTSRLKAEAHAGLDGGSLVRLDCDYDPYRVYLAVQKTEAGMDVVGMTTVLDTTFGGDTPSRQQVDRRLAGAPLGLASAQTPILEGAIDPWLPFSLEDL